ARTTRAPRPPTHTPTDAKWMAMEGTPSAASPSVRAWLFKAATTHNPEAPAAKTGSQALGPTPHSRCRRTRATTGTTRTAVIAISRSQYRPKAVSSVEEIADGRTERHSEKPLMLAVSNTMLKAPVTR